MKKLLLTTGLLLTTFGVIAKPQTITLEVPTMNCPVCPITVTKSLEKVNGVTDVEVKFEERLAKVTFDDEMTNSKALIDATTRGLKPNGTKTYYKDFLPMSMGALNAITMKIKMQYYKRSYWNILFRTKMKDARKNLIR